MTEIFQLIVLILVIMVISLMTISYLLLIFIKVPYVPSAGSVVRLLFDNFTFQKGQTFIDIGAGGGKIVFQAEKHGLQAIGYEISPMPYLISIFVKPFLRSQATLYFRNFIKADLSNADYIYCYLFPELIEEIWPKIKKECRPGTYFICNTFKLKSVRPVQIIEDQKQKPRIFIYQT